MYQAWVQVITPDYSYWNKLGPAHVAAVQAEAEIAAYKDHKREGTGGFRRGAPALTKITRPS